jgi:hypothetical protein
MARSQFEGELLKLISVTIAEQTKLQQLLH